jgi:hypothetical protein
MKTHLITTARHTIGVDLGDKRSHLWVLDAEGQITNPLVIWCTVLPAAVDNTKPFVSKSSDSRVMILVAGALTLVVRPRPFRLPDRVTGKFLEGLVFYTDGILAQTKLSEQELGQCSRENHICNLLYRVGTGEIPFNTLAGFEDHRGAPLNAWSRSAIMSSICSMPTLSRIVSGVTPARACSSKDICR